jgi:hypothetical protein
VNCTTATCNNQARHFEVFEDGEIFYAWCEECKGHVIGEDKDERGFWSPISKEEFVVLTVMNA